MIICKLCQQWSYHHPHLRSPAWHGMLLTSVPMANGTLMNKHDMKTRSFSSFIFALMRGTNRRLLCDRKYYAMCKSFFVSRSFMQMTSRRRKCFHVWPRTTTKGLFTNRKLGWRRESVFLPRVNRSSSCELLDTRADASHWNIFESELAACIEQGCRSDQCSFITPAPELLPSQLQPTQVAHFAQINILNPFSKWAWIFFWQFLLSTVDVFGC